MDQTAALRACKQTKEAYDTCVGLRFRSLISFSAETPDCEESFDEHKECVLEHFAQQKRLQQQQQQQQQPK